MELLRLSAFLTQTISYEGQKRTRFYVALDQLLNKESQALEELLHTASSVFSFK
jgi:cellobiose-specific phosphotransferase system component IIA